MGFWRARLFGQDEAGADPNGRGAESKGGGKGLAVEETAGRDALDRFLGEGGRRRFSAQRRHGGDEDRGWHVAGVAAAFAALGADYVDTDVEAFLDVFRVPDHVHVEDAGGVEAVDDGFGRDADGGDEEFGAGVDYDGG